MASINAIDNKARQAAALQSGAQIKTDLIYCATQ
jgi:hypothetical protein